MKNCARGAKKEGAVGPPRSRKWRFRPQGKKGLEITQGKGKIRIFNLMSRSPVKILASDLKKVENRFHSKKGENS